MNRPLFWLIIVVALRFIFIGSLIIFGPFSLSGDEAQYWTWSQDLSYGYYSKPPGVAWQIATTTLFFGNTEWGVRSSALLIGSCLPFALYFLGRSCSFSQKVSAAAGVAIALIPAGVIGSLLAITDGGMLLFWTLACAYFIRATTEEVDLNPVALGLLIAIGALFKWPIYILMILLLLWALIFERNLFGRVFLATLVSLVGLLPSFLWNMQHDFVTFKHVYSSLGVGGEDVAMQATPNIVDFIGAQFGLLSPLLFLFFWVAFVRFFRDKDEITKPLMFLFFISFSIIIPLLMATGTKVQGNWGDFVYPTVILFTTRYFFEVKKHGATWYGISVGLGLAISVGLVVFNSSIPFRANPMKNTLGWRNLHPALEEAGYSPDEHFLISDSYQMASLLSFYSPGQKRAYFFNMGKRRLNQFSFWPGLDQEISKSGFYVTSEEQRKVAGKEEKWIAGKSTQLEKYFEEVVPFAPYPLFMSDGEVARWAFSYFLTGFDGRMPTSSNLF